MGNQHTSAGDISITTESQGDWFSPGDRVIGTVTTRVKDNYKAKQFRISFVGLEHHQ
jgi:hypothetical protein